MIDLYVSRGDVGVRILPIKNNSILAIGLPKKLNVRASTRHEGTAVSTHIRFCYDKRRHTIRIIHRNDQIRSKLHTARPGKNNRGLPVAPRAQSDRRPRDRRH